MPILLNMVYFFRKSLGSRYSSTRSEQPRICWQGWEAGRLGGWEASALLLLRDWSDAGEHSQYGVLIKHPLASRPRQLRILTVQLITPTKVVLVNA